MTTATAERLRMVMRRHAAGVVVITSDVGEPTGFCATSLTSVSLRPPTVAFAVHSDSASGVAWRTSSHGIVHLLRADQHELAAAFARPGPDKFDGGWSAGPEGQPLLDGVQAWLLVTPRERLLVGDHLLVVARVETTGCGPSAAPLVYHDGAFHALPT